MKGTEVGYEGNRGRLWREQRQAVKGTEAGYEGNRGRL